MCKNSGSSWIRASGLVGLVVVGCGSGGVDAKIRESRVEPGAEAAPKAGAAEEELTRPLGPSFRVVGRQLVDPCGEPVLIRGVNKMNIWTDLDGEPSFAEIARSEANSVRIVWDTSGAVEDLDAVLSNSIARDLLPMIELHDATGDFSKLGLLVDYWERPDVAAVLKRHERTLLVNIGNEVGTWDVSADDYIDGYSDAISRLRAAGIRAPLVIDSRGWGHDVEFLVDVADSVRAADPTDNVMFSTHLYYTDTEPGFYDELLGQAADAELPLVIGEFGAVGFACERPVDYLALLDTAERLQIGWYAWSWGPGNSPCATFDMTSDSSFDTLYGWGREVAVDATNSIENTSSAILPLPATCALP